MALKRVETNKKTDTTPAAKDTETIKESLKKLTVEHGEIGDAILTIRHLAEGYAIPDNVCNPFVVTYRKQKDFEDDLHKHVHPENNILFTKAVQLQK